MFGLPHIRPLVEEEQKKEGNSASFSEIKLEFKGVWKVNVLAAWSKPFWELKCCQGHTPSV